MDPKVPNDAKCIIMAHGERGVRRACRTWDRVEEIRRRDQAV